MLAPSIYGDLPSSFSLVDPSQVSTLSDQVMDFVHCAPTLSPPLQKGICFLGHPLPAGGFGFTPQGVDRLTEGFLRPHRAYLVPLLAP
jgi:hypothetical protein